MYDKIIKELCSTLHNFAISSLGNVFLQLFYFKRDKYWVRSGKSILLLLFKNMKGERLWLKQQKSLPVK